MKRSLSANPTSYGFREQASYILLYIKYQYKKTQLSQAINSPSVPTAVGKYKISIEKNKEKQKKYICLFFSIDILFLY
mgnify:CR=1 FL=1